MRIVENSPERLVLRDRTVLYAVALFAGAAFMGGYFLMHGGAPVQLLVPAFFVACGFAFLRTSTVIFDKASRTCLVRRRDVFKVTHKLIPFAELSNVRLDTSTAGEWDTPTFRLTLVTRGGDAPLSAVYEAGKANYQAMRDAIGATVFDDRARPAPADPIEGMVKSGRTVDAIAYLRRRDGLGLTEAKLRVDGLRKSYGA